MSNSSDLMIALDGAMKEAKHKREQWFKEHPGEELKEVCPLCGGTGVKRVYKDIEGNDRSYLERYEPGSYEYVEPCSCVKAGMSQQYKNNKNFSSVPNMYSDATFKTFQTDIYKSMDSKQIANIAKHEAMAFAQKFDKCAEQGICLYLWSKARGSGKSRLASTICNELTAKGVRSKFVGASALLSEIQASWDDKDTSTHKIIENYIKPNLLVIDDLGEKGNKEWINNNMFLIIDKRYQERKPTVFTSNYDIMELPLDTRLTDRLTETCINIKLPNESIRQNQKNRVNEIFGMICRGESVEDVQLG